MKVLMCGNHPSNKGGMTSVISLINEQDWNKENIAFSFIPTYMPGGKGKTLLYFLQAYLKVLYQFLTSKPDVFYTHMSYKGSFFRTRVLHKLCRRFGVRDMIHLHGSEFKKWYQACDEKKQCQIRNLITECGSFIVLGDNWKQFISSIAPEANICVLNNSVKIPEKVVPAPDGVCNFLYLGVLIPRKGVEDLLKAASILQKNGKIQGMHFYIGGTGPEEEKLRSMCKAFELDDYVDFCGWVQGKYKEELILKSNVFVLPSYNEGLPMAILEAMSYGMPVLSTDVGSIGEAARDGENAQLFEPGNAEQLAHQLLNYSEQKTLWKEHAETSRRRAVEEFSDSIFFEKLVHIIRTGSAVEEK